MAKPRPTSDGSAGPPCHPLSRGVVRLQRTRTLLHRQSLSGPGVPRSLIMSSRKSCDAVLIAALAGGATITEAAAAANVSSKTVSRRLREPGFSQELREARAAVVGTAVRKLGAFAAD